MQELHAAGRNHVWAYYVRNMIRPAVIAEEKVDAIIGNPPWLTYGQSADIIREELRGMSEQRYQIWAGGKLAPTRTSPPCSTPAAPNSTPNPALKSAWCCPKRPARRPASEVAQRRL